VRLCVLGGLCELTDRQPKDRGQGSTRGRPAGTGAGRAAAAGRELYRLRSV